MLFLIGKVSSWFTSLGLIFVGESWMGVLREECVSASLSPPTHLLPPHPHSGVVLAFSLPKIYELRKPEVDALASRAAAQGQAHYKKFVEPYVSKIPRASTAAGADKKAE